MKIPANDLNFEKLLRDLLARVPFLEVEGYVRESVIHAESKERADAIARVRAGKKPWTLVIEEKRVGQPREVRAAMLQLEHSLRQIEGSNYGVLLAPFISEESAKICTEAGIGYADLSGNAHLSFDQIFIELRSADNPFREKRELRSLFTPKTERLLRVLLTPPLRSWKVEELAEAAQVSFGQVSNVRKRLLDQEWAIIDSRGLRLIKPEETARAWQKVYGNRKTDKVKTYSLLHGEALEKATKKALSEAKKGLHAVLASYSAARWLAPYARQSTQFFYVDDKGAEILQHHLQLQTVSRGENVVLIRSQEDDVFVGRIEAAPGVWCTGLVQTWLDLSDAGERGSEAAEYLLKEKLLPAWKDEM